MAADVVSSIRADGLGDYTSLAAWEAAKNYDITLATGDDTRQIAELHDAETEASWPTFQVNGGTHDESTDNYLLIRPETGNEFDPVSKTGAKLVSATGDTDHGFVVWGSQKLHGQDIGVSFIGTSTFSYTGGGYLTLNRVNIYNCRNGSCGNTATMIDSIVEPSYAGGNSAGSGGSIHAAILQNVTIIQKVGFGSYEGDIVVQDCSLSNVALYNGNTRSIHNSAYNSTGDNNNLNDNGSVDITGTDNLKTLVTGDFVDFVNGDYHAASGSNLVGAGKNLIVSGDLASPQYDIDGDQWPDSGAWDIGFDYYVSGVISLNIDREIETSWSAQLDINAPTPIDNLAQINTESPALIEHLSRAQSNRSLLTEYSSAINADDNAPIDWPGSILMDRHAPFDLISEHRSDRLLPTEHLSSLRANKTLPIDYQSLISATQFLPTEWLGQAVFVADRLLPVSWDQLIAADRSTPLDTSAQINLSRALPVSFLSSALADRSAPVSHLFSVNADRTLPVEWSGQLVVNADAIFPIEWRGGVLLNADKTLPLSWLTEFEADQPMGFGSLLTVVTDQLIPTSFNAALVADQAAVISWLESLGADKTLLFEHRGVVVVNSDQTMPIEWGGVSGFVAGNLHVFNIDDRGHIWHVPARGQTWRVPPRRK